MGLEKLRIVPLNAQFRETGDVIEAMYNPNQFTIETRNQFQRTAMPGLPTPITQFVSGETQTLSFDLFFDSYEQGTDVRQFTSKVTNLLKINRELHAPPVCKFIWGGPMAGDISNFSGVIDRVTQKFTMFLETGIPVRATLTLNVSEFRTLQEQLKIINLHSADRTKVRLLKEGEQLWHWADREYGDPAEWRVIAEANDIDNPRLVVPGTQLRIPPLE